MVEHRYITASGVGEQGQTGVAGNENNLRINRYFLSVHHQPGSQSQGSPPVRSLPQHPQNPLLQIPLPANYRPSASRPQRIIKNTHMHVYPIQQQLLKATSDG